MREFENAAADWSGEVDRVAADLVKQGVPPWQAIVDAGRIVRERRERKARTARHGATGWQEFGLRFPFAKSVDKDGWGSL